MEIVEFVALLPPILPGAIIALRVDPIVDRQHMMLKHLHEAIEVQVGHNEFLIIILPDSGKIDVVAATEALAWLQNYLGVCDNE